jgi:hypothetical protein
VDLFLNYKTGPTESLLARNIDITLGAQNLVLIATHQKSKSRSPIFCPTAAAYRSMELMPPRWVVPLPEDHEKVLLVRADKLAR